MTMADVHAECDQFARAEAKHATLTLQERGLGLVRHDSDPKYLKRAVGLSRRRPNTCTLQLKLLEHVKDADGLPQVQHGADGRSVVILSSGLCVSFQTTNENQNKRPAVVRPGRKALSGSGLRAHADVLGSLFENGLMSEEVSASA